MDREASPSLLTQEAPFFLWMGAAALLFAVLGALGAVTDPWGVDESFTYSLIQHPLADMMQRIVRDVHPPLFYLIMAGWERLWPAPQAMQILTLLFGLAAVWVAGLIGRQIGGRGVGVAAAMLWATCPMFLHFSQDARMYGLGLLCELLAIEGWVLAGRRPRAGWLFFVAGLTAAIYTHNHCLVFAGVFVAAEALRCATTHRKNPTGWRWILSATIVVALLYLPWVPVLLRQMQVPNLAGTFDAPDWPGTLWAVFFTSYALHPLTWGNAIAWVPGILLLGVLPLGALIGKKGVAREVSRPLWILYAVALGPLALLWCYSRWHQPVMFVSRHGVLFLPLLLLPAAMWARRLDGAVARPRWWREGLLALLSLNAYVAMKEPRDLSADRLDSEILDKAPLGAPLLTFPLTKYDAMHLDLGPLPMAAVDSPASIPEHFTSCTLIVRQENGPERDLLFNRSRLLLSQAASVQRVYSSYYFTAFVLRGLPDGAARGFFFRSAGGSEALWEELLGHWALAKSWDVQALTALGSGKVQPSTLRLGRTALRLEAPRTSWLLLPPAVATGSYLAVCMGGDVEGTTTPFEIQMQIGSRPPQIFQIEAGRVLLLDQLDPTTHPLAITLSVPEPLTRREASLEGYTPPGVYLLGACCVQLRPQDFQREGHSGRFIDIGALGDQLFLRPSYYEREGIPSNNYRWTRQQFELEVPVWADRPNREVILWGFLPKEIPNRTVQLSIDPPESENAENPAPTALATAGATSYGAVTFQLPRPLAAGIHRLRVRLGGTFIPAEHGNSHDPRRLGFYLDGVEIK